MCSRDETAYWKTGMMEHRNDDVLKSRAARHAYVFSVRRHAIVAQSCTLLYRRVALCGPDDNPKALTRSDAVPTTTRRYSRVKLCATPSPLWRDWPSNHVTLQPFN